MTASLLSLMFIVMALIILSLLVVHVRARRQQVTTQPAVEAETTLSTVCQAVSEEAADALEPPISIPDPETPVIYRAEDMQIGDTFYLITESGSKVTVTLLDHEGHIFDLTYAPSRTNRNKPLRHVRAALISSIRPGGCYMHALVSGCPTVWIRVDGDLRFITSPITRILESVPQAA